MQVHRPYSAMPADGGVAPSVQAPSQSDGVGAGTGPRKTGVLDELSSAFASARTTFSSFLDLMGFEARRAGLALMWMVGLGVIGAVCVVSAWLGLMAALAMWTVSLGFPVIAAVVAVAVINCVAGAMLISVCVGRSRDLLFSATRRQLSGKSPVRPPIL